MSAYSCCDEYTEHALDCPIEHGIPALEKALALSEAKLTIAWEALEKCSEEKTEFMGNPTYGAEVSKDALRRIAELGDDKRIKSGPDLDGIFIDELGCDENNGLCKCGKHHEEIE